jgi:hypothetical protein
LTSEFIIFLNDFKIVHSDLLSFSTAICKLARLFVKNFHQEVSILNMSFARSTRTRTKVQCFCDKCNGALVDPRTKKRHMSKRINYQEPGPSDEIDDIEMDHNEIDDNAMEYEMDHNEIDDNAVEHERNYIFLTKKLPINESEKSLTKKGKISDRVLENLYMDDDEDSEDGDSDDEDSENEEENDDYEEINFASPDFDNDEPKLPPNLNNDAYIWVILWILQYQQRYKLSNIAIDSMFKFLSFFLSTIDASKFSSFPSSLYMARKKLGIPTEVIQYAACTKCHKLYNINELDKTEVQTCSFINFPNHTIQRFRQKCNNPLTKKINNNNEQILRPIMTYPLVNIRQQLTLFFGRKDFEMSCRKWAERKNDTEALFDIYDGRIWKGFTDDDDGLFFTKEHADTHLGLIINMDWFQPFDSSPYSVGVIYAVICNLPRTERYKSHNILTLAVIPGPHEPKLHEINNYLYPIISQLVHLWSGYNIVTHESNSGRFVRGAIIGCSSDVPATRKLCGFISARIACYRCHKSVNYVNNQPNFGGFSDFEDWFVERNVDIIREKANEWKKCQTEESRKAHVSQHHVRWSEIYNLHYFNPVRHCVVDPMHCLFLGVAKWIVMKLWIGEGILDDAKLKIMQKRADAIKITSDLGRRPARIATGDGFSNFTADMWKTFILIFAIPITWDFLDEDDKKILSYFVRACKILTSRELQKSELSEAFTKLVNMNKLVEQKYGQEKISPNLHLCLHICECALDYGPLSSFWCFSFERMNGILGTLINLSGK